jgi:hypothetical protein
LDSSLQQKPGSDFGFGEVKVNRGELGEFDCGSAGEAKLTNLDDAEVGDDFDLVAADGIVSGLEGAWRDAEVDLAEDMKGWCGERVGLRGVSELEEGGRALRSAKRSRTRVRVVAWSWSMRRAG